MTVSGFQGGLLGEFLAKGLETHAPGLGEGLAMPVEYKSELGSVRVG